MCNYFSEKLYMHKSNNYEEDTMHQILVKEKSRRGDFFFSAKKKPEPQCGTGFFNEERTADVTDGPYCLS